jgi:5-formyltetrahydrofolate cyclo-ligase
MRHDGIVTANSWETSQQKAIVRRRIRNARAVQAPFERAEAGRAFAHGVLEVINPLRPACIAAYFSTASEPSTDELLNELWSRNIQVLTPRVDGEALLWVDTERDTPTKIGAFGIREAQGTALVDLGHAQVIVLPALAIDPMGHRLGQGGGFYDRALSQFEMPPLLIAVVHDSEDQEDIPVESHDARVDVVVTNARIRYITPKQK